MAVRIFDLRGVPDDEAEDVRQLLSRYAIEYYETPAGRWGISSPGLWILDNTQAKCSRELIARYQQDRAMRARQLYNEQCAQGQQPTLWHILTQDPLRVIAAFLVIAILLYLTIAPFVKVASG